MRTERNIYQRVNRDGPLGRFRAIGEGGVRRTFEALAAARELRDREAALSPEQVEALKPDTRIDQELIERVLPTTLSNQTHVHQPAGCHRA